MYSKSTLLSLGLALLTCMTDTLTHSASAQESTPATGTTRVAQWTGDKKAAFVMRFDDACPTHVKNVIPELNKRNLMGTFYIIPAKGEYIANKSFWEVEAPKSPNVVYGNHTFSHQALTDMDQAEKEIVRANEHIMKLFPGKSPRLISYATPGGPKHLITETQVQELLSKHHLVHAPSFHGHGAAIHFKTSSDILNAVDKAIGNGGAEYVIFHGVGGDWISFDLAQFIAMLDGIVARQDSLWVTDPISIHKYETERSTAKAQVAETTGSQIKLELRSEADASLYDLPLTLVTKVPAAWVKCQVKQGAKMATVPVVKGEVIYDALPNGGPITLVSQPAS